MTKSKLIIVYPNQFGYHTDSYKYCQYIADQFDITYICFDQGYVKLEMSNVDIVYVSYNASKIKRLFLFYRTVFYTCSNYPDNILFTIQFKFSFLIGLFAKSKLKVLDYRTGDLSTNKLLRKLKNYQMYFDSLFFQNITVISEGLKVLLKLNKKSIILPLGADEISNESKKYNQLKLLYVGAISKRNIFETVEGLSLFLKNKPEHRLDITYDIVGFGEVEDIKKIEKIVVENGLQDIVTYHGRKPYDQLRSFFDKCNIGVSYIPNTEYYQYQPSTKTFEYALSGLYVIATNTYENRNVITQENGVLCDDTPASFAEAITRVIQFRHNINDVDIRKSLQSYHWRIIVVERLLPLLRSKV